MSRVVTPARLSLAWLALGATVGCSEPERDPTPAPSATASSESRVDPGRDVHGDPSTIAVFEDARIESDADSPTFHRVQSPLEIPPGPYERATLVLDLSSSCFPFESWADNPPPAGENWPADCDAFDRNFEVRLDPPVDVTDPPAIELERAITPFGGPLHLEVDVTDVANGLPGPHVVEAFIPAYGDPSGIATGSRGGWNVSARLDLVPGRAPREVLAVVPLFDGEETTTDGRGPLAFDVPDGARSGRLEYRVTGHGGGAVGTGCIGPAEEFCKRDHSLFVDGELLERVTPWRSNCEELCTLTHHGPADAGFDYCAENPCGAVSSVRASRANWCPGSETPPYAWSVPALGEPGPHTLEWQISELADGGRWRISAVYYAFASP